MATITRLTTWVANDTLTAAALNAEFNNILSDYNGGITNANISAGAAIGYSKLSLTGGIVNADISASAAIADSKLATISTANKVSASALAANWSFYVPTVTGGTGGPMGLAKYTQIGNVVFVIWQRIGCTSNLASFTISLPVTPTAVTATGGFDIFPIIVDDNGSPQADMGIVGIQANVATATIGKTTSTIAGNVFGGFTASGVKLVTGMIIYTAA